jgi:hypothetical protein
VHRRNVPYRHTALRQQFGQHPAARGDARTRPVTRNDARIGQPQTRNAAPRTRALPAVPSPRTERFTPPASDRWTERNRRAEVQRLQTRAPNSRSATVVPRMAPLPRPSVPPPAVRAQLRPVTPPHVVRAAPRPRPPAANTRVAPRQQVQPDRRAETRSPVRPNVVVPRPVAGTPIHVPRLDSGHARRGLRTFGSGQPRARPRSGGGRRS